MRSLFLFPKQALQHLNTVTFVPITTLQKLVKILLANLVQAKDLKRPWLCTPDLSTYEYTPFHSSPPFKLLCHSCSQCADHVAEIVVEGLPASDLL
jgi:hypothetical protein